MLTNTKTKGLTKNHSLVGCNPGLIKIRNSVGIAFNNSLNKKNVILDLIFTDNKKFSRKALLKDKIGSLKESNHNRAKLYPDFLKKKPLETYTKRQESISVKKKTSKAAKIKISPDQFNSGKVSIDSLNELTKSDLEQELADKPYTDPEFKHCKAENKNENKNVTLSNLFSCLNTDKTLKDTRLNLRVS